ncbi:hypothetical protein TWF281_005797 [Arthrobotrys megalospora]
MEASPPLSTTILSIRFRSTSPRFPISQIRICRPMILLGHPQLPLHHHSLLGAPRPQILKTLQGRLTAAVILNLDHVLETFERPLGAPTWLPEGPAETLPDVMAYLTLVQNEKLSHSMKATPDVHLQRLAMPRHNSFITSLSHEPL